MYITFALFIHTNAEILNSFIVTKIKLFNNQKHEEAKCPISIKRINKLAFKVYFFLVLRKIK